MNHLVEHVISAMGTVVAIQLVGPDNEALLSRARDAMQWAAEVERICSRFDPDSELSRLCAVVGEPVPVSPLLEHLLDLAVAVARTSDGAFDPTVGSPPPATWQSIQIDRAAHTVTLHHPLRLDLGAIAKGFAVDLMAQTLHDLPDIAIDAGGDLYCRGHNLLGRPWSIGIRDPFVRGALLARVSIDSGALCTSGSYERRTADGHHLIDPTTGRASQGLVSCSVVGESTAMADALATAAFIMGRERGLPFLEAQGVDALLIDDRGDWHVVNAGGRVHPPGFQNDHPVS